MIAFKCLTCGEKIEVDGGEVGKPWQCPRCQEWLKVPGKAVTESVVPAVVPRIMREKVRPGMAMPAVASTATGAAVVKRKKPPAEPWHIGFAENFTLFYLAIFVVLTVIGVIVGIVAVEGKNSGGLQLLIVVGALAAIAGELFMAAVVLTLVDVARNVRALRRKSEESP